MAITWHVLKEESSSLSARSAKSFEDIRGTHRYSTCFDSGFEDNLCIQYCEFQTTWLQLRRRQRISIMEAANLTLVARLRLLPPQQQTKSYAWTAESCKIAAFGRSASIAGSSGFDLRGRFRRKQTRELLLGSCDVRGVEERRQRQRRRGGAVNVSAMDASQPFYHESTRSQELEKNRKLKVGIVGFGNFGQFLAERILQQGHKVLAHSRRDYTDKARKIGVTYFRDADDFCEEHPEVVLLCTSIMSTEAVLHSLPLQRLKRNTLFVDVLSVKEFPKNLFLKVLPSEFDVLCTHPMFGPESGKGSWAGLPFVYDKVRISNGRRSRSADRFLDIFASEGCRMVEMSCVEHDRFAAGSQFITHTVGRVLGKLGLQSTPINTKGYETLLGLVQNTSGDSFELYYGLFMYNANATEELQRLEVAFDSTKKQLFGQLHNVLRKQLFNGEVATKNNRLQGFKGSSSNNGSKQLETPYKGGLGIVSNIDSLSHLFDVDIKKSIKLDKDHTSQSQRT